MNRHIVISDIEPAQLSFRHPLGINLDLSLTMETQSGLPVDPAPLNPQFVLLPRSQGGVYPYDMTIPTEGSSTSNVKIPGISLMDENGYNIELYFRQSNSTPGDPALPISLAAKGVMITEGSAYSGHGPMNLTNVPVVVGPAGPVGPTGASGPPGAPGSRGAVWFTGTGPPGTITNQQPGDMYLDETNGDVWRFDGAVWAKGTF